MGGGTTELSWIQWQRKQDEKAPLRPRIIKGKRNPHFLTDCRESGKGKIRLYGGRVTGGGDARRRKSKEGRSTRNSRGNWQGAGKEPAAPRHTRRGTGSSCSAPLFPRRKLATSIVQTRVAVVRGGWPPVFLAGRGDFNDERPILPERASFSTLDHTGPSIACELDSQGAASSTFDDFRPWQ